jgi:NADPH:quinone reductase-like Zn-dependent oxidoreductase
MQAFEIQEFGVDNLKLVERAMPQPGPHEVRVRLTAASLNFRDLMVVEGHYNPKLKRPLVPLSDGVGIVESTGPGVTRVRTGERVAGIFMQKWIDGGPGREKSASALGGAVDGVLAEHKIFHEEGLVSPPAHLSDVEAATLPCAGVTAWHALFEERQPQPGDSLLILGTGGVATFALQFGQLAGLRTIVLSSSNDKLARAQAMGASDTINYRERADWDKAVRELLPEGVDAVLEVGGSDTLARSLKAVRMGGIVMVIGALSGGEPTVSPVPILMNTLQVQGIYVGSRSMFERMNRAMDQHQIKPVVDRVFPWQEVRQAMHYMQSQQHLGKICLKF